ncbi:hypothetical protein [Pseudomonas sp. MF4836]|uniref:hypothetical protein n=1 Tax=Pseudomonas sp. MF4836 TaxID=1960827 RepID=UPI00128FCFB7|nr:hypothetical protein [Pseudomonas sp. MF4836]
MAGGAAGVGAGYDIQDGLESFKLREHTFAAFYFLRASAQTGAASLSIAIGLASAGPYLEYLIKKHGAKHFLGAFLSRLSGASSMLALRMLPMLRIFFGLNVLFIALVVIEIFFLPNALERYLSHSAFRKNRSNGIADTEQKELEILQRAIGSTL